MKRGNQYGVLMQRARAAAAVLALISAVCAKAADANGELRAGSGVPWLDKPHELISGGIHEVSERFDRFFDVTGEEDVGATRVRITTGTDWRESGSVKLRTGAGVRLDLPRLQRRWNLLLEDIALSEETVTEQNLGDEVSAALRLLLRQTRSTRLHADGGMRFSGVPVLFGRLRLRWQNVRDPHVFRVYQFLHWYDREGFGETTRMAYEWIPSRDYLLQIRGDFDWGEKTQGVEWKQRVAFANILRERYGWEIFAGLSGVTDPAPEIDSYRAGIRYRRRLYRDWLFMDLVPGMEGRRKDNFSPAAVMSVSIETIFGR